MFEKLFIVPLAGVFFVGVVVGFVAVFALAQVFYELIVEYALERVAAVITHFPAARHVLQADFFCRTKSASELKKSNFFYRDRIHPWLRSQFETHPKTSTVKNLFTFISFCACCTLFSIRVRYQISNSLLQIAFKR